MQKRPAAHYLQPQGVFATKKEKGEEEMNQPKLCTVCGNRTTRHPSEICARCRRRAESPVKLCVCCEQRRTRDESGYCYMCRNKAVTQNYGIQRIDAAIERQKTVLSILEKKKEGLSLREISRVLAIPKSSVSNIYRAAVFNAARATSFADVAAEERIDQL